MTNCLKYLLAALVCSMACAQPHKFGLTCPRGWKLYPNEGRCFKKVVAGKNWHAAKAHCENLGGNLVTIASAKVNSFVSTMLHPNGVYWTGLNDLKTEGVYHWLDATASIAFRNWAPSKFNHWPHEDCIVINGPSDYTWLNRDCSRQHSSICERWAYARFSNGTMIKCPEGSFYYHEDRTCVKLYHGSETWVNARATCQRDGGDLVQVWNEDKNSFILGLVQRFAGLRERIWIGLTDRVQENSFRWLDLWQAKFTYWAKNAPHNYRGDEDCVYMLAFSYHQWNDIDCHWRFSFMCQKIADGFQVDVSLLLPW